MKKNATSQRSYVINEQSVLDIAVKGVHDEGVGKYPDAVQGPRYAFRELPVFQDTGFQLEHQ